MLNGNILGFNSLPSIIHAKTRSINAENPRGEAGSGGKLASNLGKGRKGCPCIPLPKGQDTKIAEISGTGVIQHIWMTVTDKTEEIGPVFRDLILKMYWDDEDTPSVEVPLGDFFCNGFGVRCNINSLPIAVNPNGGLNSYFSMPFKESAKIFIENQHACDLKEFFYQITYTLVDHLPENTGYFHASWRREPNGIAGKDYVILDHIRGSGHYIGTYLAWTSLQSGWWGEGEIKFYMDGDLEWPTICGTGTEDYFGGAWNFANFDTNKPESYSTPFLGYHYYEENTKIDKWFGHKLPYHGLYRWHMLDPIRFENKLKVTIQKIGHNGKFLFERGDDIASVAYWYQTEPHVPFPRMPKKVDRWPR